MKYKLVLFIFCLFIIYPILACLGNSKNTYFLSGGKAVVFLDAQDGYKYVSGSGFIDSLSTLDISLRMEKDFFGTGDLECRSGYRSFYKDQFRNWSAFDKNYAMKLLKRAYCKIDSIFPAVIPDTLFLIRTTGRQEFKSYYTLKNAIICPSSIRLGSTYLPFLGYINKYLERVFIHEMFHIFSTNHPAIRDSIYKQIGFTHIDFLSLPHELKNRIILNPDDKPGYYKIALADNVTGENSDYYLAILSKYPRWSGYIDFPARLNVLLVYLDPGLIKIENEGNGWRVVKDQNQAYQVVPINSQKDFNSKTGLGKEAISPEEIAAHVFICLIQSKFDTAILKTEPASLLINCNNMEMLLRKINPK